MHLYHVSVYISFILCVLEVTAQQGCMNDNDCMNGGNCNNDNCNCDRPYFGVRCENVNTESCNGDNECRNGGNCWGQNNNQVCVCDGFWYGPTCETICPGSTFVYCQNGGTCVEDKSRRDDFFCECADGFSGLFCEACPNDQCLNGGTRDPAVTDRVVCICPPEWRGPCCQDEIICDPSCKNGGTCVENSALELQCVCPEGWTGEFCEIVICNPPCENGGFCILSSGECICPFGWTGPSCKDAADMPQPPCDSDPCLNGGTCINLMQNMFECQCPVGFTGQLCEEQVTPPCSSSPCQNGGTCMEVGTGMSAGYNCSCPSLYFGTNCESNACDAASPCMNGGTCVVSGEMVSCECPPDWTGVFCEESLGTGGGSTGNFLQDNLVVIIAAAVGAALVISILLVCIICCCCMRRTKKDSRSRSRARRMRNAPPASTQRGTHQNGRNDYIEMTQRKRMEFPRKNLRFKESIGSGAFATVYKADAYSIIKPGQKSLVAVKVLKENATENDRKDFMKELALFKALGKHENLVTFLGCCTDQDPIYLIMEYLPNGNLQQHLRSLINKNPNSNTYNNQMMQNSLSPTELLAFGIQIAKGMEFLASRSCVHRDLAARNILLGENNICKISDFGLSRDMADSQQYEMKSRGRVPVRWLSPESLLQNIYTSKSDVWSFGIVMWEIITLGSHPYPGMTPRKVLEAIQTGYRLPQPDHCDDQIYGMLMSCWEENPDNRPNFKEIRMSLEQMLEADQGYLQMDNFHQDNYLYLAPDVALAEEI